MLVDTAVIVVGAGPTGLMLAGELALGGVAVEVVDRQTVPGGQSRGGGVNSRTAEVLAMRGLIDGVADQAIPRTNVGGHFAGLPVALDTRPWRTRYPGGLLVLQDRLEEVLEDHLVSVGVGVRRGTELTGLDAVEDGVTVTVRGPGGEYRMRGRYLVACDGGHSTVRKLTGVAFPGRTGTMAAVSADIELTAWSTTVPRAVDHISRLTRKGGGYWMLLHPSAGPGENLYRVVFGGDAAHIHSPVGGQGLNVGVQDAANLGWKLAAQVRGDAPEGLLDSYHSERHPVAARVIATVRAQHVLMSPSPDADDVLALRAIVIDLARLPDANRYLAGLMSGLDLRYDLGGSDPLVGTRMPDLDLSTAGGTTTRVSTLLRSGHGLLLELGDAIAADALPAGVDRVTARPAETAGSETLPGIGTDTGAAPDVDRILIRPDGYVCWVGAGPQASPAAALERWFGAAALPAS
ncbi:MAG TPA: FAD-dependent monooxygenase [Pseudonocardiaceae bacterium]|nr:FAD-dependent monooxygenase [Pseudonocardiaceae bacterium]